MASPGCPGRLSALTPEWSCLVPPGHHRRHHRRPAPGAEGSDLWQQQEERILRGLAAWQQQRQLLAQHRSRQRRLVVDLDGQHCWMLPEEIQSFHQCCWAELGLAASSPWPLVRRQWRRSSLRWHPDHGGDPATWLRKQRAYEALKNAVSQPRWFEPGEATPRRIVAQRQSWSWPWRRG